jgi:hypothetical protein
MWSRMRGIEGSIARDFDNCGEFQHFRSRRSKVDIDGHLGRHAREDGAHSTEGK